MSMLEWSFLIEYTVYSIMGSIPGFQSMWLLIFKLLKLFNVVLKRVFPNTNWRVIPKRGIAFILRQSNILCSYPNLSVIVNSFFLSACLAVLFMIWFQSVWMEPQSTFLSLSVHGRSHNQPSALLHCSFQIICYTASCLVVLNPPFSLGQIVFSGPFSALFHFNNLNSLMNWLYCLKVPSVIITCKIIKIWLNCGATTIWMVLILPHRVRLITFHLEKSVVPLRVST